MPYGSLVLSVQKVPKTSRMWFSTASEMIAKEVPSAGCVDRLVGLHKCSLSLAKQWGWFGEGKGWRLGWYGHGLAAPGVSRVEVMGDGSGELK